VDFGFSEEQNLLREQVVRFMAEACPLPTVRTLAAGDDERRAALWQQIAELGWLALTVPEQYGGVGLKWIDLAVVLEEAGRGLLPLPVLSQALAATALGRCGGAAERKEWLPRIAAGEAVFGIGLYDDPTWIDPQGITFRGGETLRGAKPFVQDGAGATHLLIATRQGDELGGCARQGALALAIASAADAEVKPQPGIDQTKPTATAIFDRGAQPLAVLPMSAEDLAYLTDCGAVAASLEAIGAAEATMQMTTEYAKTRIQFDNPIGKYQGVKHRLADMFVDIESFKSLAYYAAWAVDDAIDELPRAASLAKAYASDAFARIGIDGVGLHGAIGYTAEYDAQLYLKRSKWVRSAFGDADFHYRRVAAMR
jgi:alkylation response protein AidB-like acyl-CoA dehydrogenase